MTIFMLALAILGGLPEGVVPIFFASKTQEIFEVKADEDVTAESPFKMLKKEDIINDMRNRAAVSDFHPVKQLILVGNIFSTIYL